MKYMGEGMRRLINEAQMEEFRERMNLARIRDAHNGSERSDEYRIAYGHHRQAAGKLSGILLAYGTMNGMTTDEIVELKRSLSA